MDNGAFDLIESAFTELASQGIVPGLGRLLNLLPLLDDPQKACPAVHVVGTNGKGSTCATLTSIMRAAGFKTALYTSPHLVSFGERLLINGEQVKVEKWQEALEKIETALKKLPDAAGSRPTYFELITAAAFIILAAEKPDLAVIEAGLGGRLDATNTLGDVLLTLAAPIGMDHTEYLGEDLRTVAAEKFAVVRKDVPAIFAGGGARLEQQFLDTSAERGALGRLLRDAVQVVEAETSFSGTDFAVKYAENTLKLHTPLIGLYQAENAALAIAGALLLLERPQFAERLTQDIKSSLQSGVAETSWEGRIEMVAGDPITVLDGAHNPHAMDRLVETLAKLAPGPLNIVLALMRDKDADGLLRRLKPLEPVVYCTQVPGMERCRSARSLHVLAARTGLELAGEFSDPIDAARAARASGRTTVCCGSLFLVGYLKEKKDELLRV